MHENQSYVIGDFQPLTKSSISAVRPILADSDDSSVSLRVYVREPERGPMAPWSFEQVKSMWGAIFDVDMSMGNLRVEISNGKPPDGTQVEIVYGAEEEALARRLLNRRVSYDPLWNHEAIPAHVARLVASFEDQEWRKYLSNGSGPSVLP